MVKKSLQSEILLELVFSVSLEDNEQLILNKSIPLYLKRLNCFLSGVLKKDKEGNLHELMVMPFAAGKTDEWESVKTYFCSLDFEARLKCPLLIHNDFYYYGLCLNGYGLIILGRKKAFDHFFSKELQNVAHHLGKILIQSNEIERRLNTEKKLRESENRLSMLMQESPSVIEIYDVDGLQISVNKAYEKLWGVQASKTLFHFNILKDKAIKDAGLNKYIERAYHGESVSLHDYQFQTKMMEPSAYSSHERWLSTKMYPLKNQHGEVTHVVLNHEDVTKQKEAEIKILKAKDRAEESDRLKSAFLANMSHEIRTPMNGILGFADLLKYPVHYELDRDMYIDLIEESGARMLNIIDDLIYMSKVESGQMEISVSETSINKQIESVYNVFQSEAKSKNIEFSVTKLLPKNGSIIRTDREKLNIILTNLVKNAIKFCVEGSIEISVVNKGDCLEFLVKDTGIGIPKERQEAIFDRFIQADIGDQRAFEGAGLGLSISKAFVDMLGGEIWLKSKQGIGTTFYFTLPLNLDVEEDDSLKHEMFSSKFNQNDMNLKVLIVEDDNVSMNLIDLLLKPLSREIITAKNGEEAVKLYAENQDIDLILMDIKMPELDGYAATRQIREMNKGVIIIAQTAFVLPGDKEKSIAAGCNDYITKPIFKEKLMRLISKYFNNLVEHRINMKI